MNLAEDGSIESCEIGDRRCPPSTRYRFAGQGSLDATWQRQPCAHECPLICTDSVQQRPISRIRPRLWQRRSFKMN